MIPVPLSVIAIAHGRPPIGTLTELTTGRSGRLVSMIDTVPSVWLAT
jgi:hypothetical protein